MKCSTGAPERACAAATTRRGGTQAGHPIGGGAILGLHADPVLPSVTNQEEGLSGLLSRRPRVRVVYC